MHAGHLQRAVTRANDRVGGMIEVTSKCRCSDLLYRQISRSRFNILVSKS